MESHPSQSKTLLACLTCKNRLSSVQHKQVNCKDHEEAVFSSCTGITESSGSQCSRCHPPLKLGHLSEKKKQLVNELKSKEAEINSIHKGLENVHKHSKIANTVYSNLSEEVESWKQAICHKNNEIKTLGQVIQNKTSIESILRKKIEHKENKIIKIQEKRCTRRPRSMHTIKIPNKSDIVADKQCLCLIL